ncbi:Signal transduction histidine kinase [Oceanobacillus limi]|uniref:histidine kinase n=1 Tax=Oceanobacillus limi TaxID=930131 RepID=A0A1I0FFI5_9BACI|nr:HAMP domain-containing sensor histidine kinase [Oceanobacillus limi]SET56945.1 Signal transduction histidine kinase [Oceanobacillus limi]
MDTKWKSKIGIVTWLVITAYGVSGVLSAWFHGVYDDRFQLVIFWIYTAGAIIALIASFILENRHKLLTKMVPEKWQEFYNRIPLDVAVLLFGVTIIVMMNFSVGASHIYYLDEIFFIRAIIYQWLYTTILLALTLLQGVYFYRRVNDFSAFQEDWKNALFMRLLQALRDAFLNRKVGTQFFLAFVFVFFLGVGTGLVAVDGEILAFVIPSYLFIGIPLFFMVVRRVGFFNRIVRHTNAVAEGSAESDIKIKGKSALAQLATDINKMKHGVRTSQQAQAKSERLKTELITNVSHDLRTPLTSIMTYSDLLKKPDLTDDERRSYIEIVDRKSKRLKVLIDDLFEASKMASGNIELTKEKVDIVQLLQQSLAEYDEMIQESTIQFRVSKPEESIEACVDGQKLWRVFDNLIGNILKYSLPHTRAYIDIGVENHEIKITFKNISEYELSEDIDELFERFKRGDESRHTDGSGLGLAIAKSIIDLHGGALDITVDGDLFKVQITIDIQS